MRRGPYRKRPLADRFWARVDQAGDCWLWQGARIRGYGALRLAGQTVYAHRIAWELRDGPIAPGLSVLHRCDNPPCVRPDHLFLGTQADNLRDAAGKARMSSGEGRNNHKVSAADVLEMRRLHGEEGILSAALAERYPISARTIRKILSGRNWRHAGTLSDNT